MESKLIFQKMALVLQDINAIGKNKKSQGGQTFAYRGIDDVLNSLNPIFAKHGVFAVPEVLERSRDERINKNGTVLSFVTLRVRYTFFAEDGSYVSSVVDGEAMDSGDKATSKAMSIAMKYAFFQTFCIPIEDVEDPDSKNQEMQEKAKNQMPTSDEVKQKLVKTLAEECGSASNMYNYLSKSLLREIKDVEEITPQDINVIRLYYKNNPPHPVQPKEF